MDTDTSAASAGIRRKVFPFILCHLAKCSLRCPSQKTTTSQQVSSYAVSLPSYVFIPLRKTCFKKQEYFLKQNLFLNRLLPCHNIRQGANKINTLTQNQNLMHSMHRPSVIGTNTSSYEQIAFGFVFVFVVCS